MPQQYKDMLLVAFTREELAQILSGIEIKARIVNGSIDINAYDMADALIAALMDLP